MVNKTSDELWGVFDHNDRILWTFGGSSTSPKLMVYTSEAKAVAGVNRQSSLTSEDTSIKKIW